MNICIAIIAGMASLFFAALSVTAAPFEIEGVIKQVRKIETKPPYTFDDKPVVSVYVVGHRFGMDFDYQYMVVQDTTQLEGSAIWVRPFIKTVRAAGGKPCDRSSAVIR